MTERVLKHKGAIDDFLPSESARGGKREPEGEEVIDSSFRLADRGVSTEYLATST